MYKSQMTNQERDSRSKLKPVISYREFINGSLSVRKLKCGKLNCKCAKTNYRHICLYLTRTKNGKFEQLFIPKEKEELVRRWVNNYRNIHELLEKISSIYWDKIKRKTD
jgi:predicted small metal-binding protein